MNESSLLREIVSLFDGTYDKLCPILGYDSLLTPATFVRVTSGARDKSTGLLKVTFELRHRYRNADPSDGIAAFGYLERLIDVAENTGKATLLSLSGVSAASDGTASECMAKLEYTREAKRAFGVMVGETDVSSYIKKLTLKDIGTVRTRQYIYDAHCVRDRVGGECAVGLECSVGDVSRMLNLFGDNRFELTVSVGGFNVHGEFVLCEMNAADTVYCELMSVGRLEYTITDFNDVDAAADNEGGTLWKVE